MLSEIACYLSGAKLVSETTARIYSRQMNMNTYTYIAHQRIPYRFLFRKPCPKKGDQSCDSGLMLINGRTKLAECKIRRKAESGSVQDTRDGSWRCRKSIWMD